MFEPAADEGCPSCSFTMDNVGNLDHLYARDTSFAAVSRAPLNKLEQYRQRMGWTFPWYSSHGSDFNYDFHVTLDASVAPVEYNYKDEAELVRLDPRMEAGAAKSTASVLSSARVSTSSTPTPVTRAPPRFSSAPTTGSTSPRAAARKTGNQNPAAVTTLHELAAPPRRIRTRRHFRSEDPRLTVRVTSVRVPLPAIRDSRAPTGGNTAWIPRSRACVWVIAAPTIRVPLRDT